MSPEKKPRRPTCRFCRRSATGMCAAVLAHTLGGEEVICGRQICDDHSHGRGGASVYCPQHRDRPGSAVRL